VDDLGRSRERLFQSDSNNWRPLAPDATKDVVKLNAPDKTVDAVAGAVKENTPYGIGLWCQKMKCVFLRFDINESWAFSLEIPIMTPCHHRQRRSFSRELRSVVLAYPPEFADHGSV